MNHRALVFIARNHEEKLLSFATCQNSLSDLVAKLLLNLEMCSSCLMLHSNLSFDIVEGVKGLLLTGSYILQKVKEG